MRLIDADALNASLLLWDGSETKYCYPCREILTTIDAQPTVDAVTVRHGEWLWLDGVRCSKCNYKLETTGLPNYCPNCGARMDEE